MCSPLTNCATSALRRLRRSFGLVNPALRQEYRPAMGLQITGNLVFALVFVAGVFVAGVIKSAFHFVERAKSAMEFAKVIVCRKQSVLHPSKTEHLPSVG